MPAMSDINKSSFRENLLFFKANIENTILVYIEIMFAEVEIITILVGKGCSKGEWSHYV